MRLLNTKTLSLEEFYTDIPPYAILSHTWEKEEITFQDIQYLETAKRKTGFIKVKNACARARKYKFDWIWIDSCCINKESSAELSEAINSMYQYYADAAVCYVYLCDVSAEWHPRDHKSNFSKSRWFMRGWTLQELLAPEYVVFLDEEWTRVGTRWSLRDVISAITSIPVEVFEGCDIDEYSVAQRMSWAALRETTRPEDQAYCLMGIFCVSMPPIYGEGGAKAFMRLQQEIIKISDDRSIFAWVASEDSKEKERGMLARSPYEFRMSGEVKASNPDLTGKKSAYSFGNNGLRIHLPLLPSNTSRAGKDLFLASLNCQSGSDGSYISIYLQETSGHRYVRLHPDTLALMPSSTLGIMQELTVKESLVPRMAPKSRFRSHYARVQLLPSAQGAVRSCTVKNTACVEVTRPFTLQYQLKISGDSFYINVWQFQTPFVQLRDTLSASDRMDTVLWRSHFPSPSLISVICEMTSDHSQTIQIDYIPRENPRYNFLTRLLQPVNLGIMVLPESNSILLEIFPPDIFGRRLKSEAYVTVSNTDSDGGSESNMFRILSYRHSNSLHIFYVALGFQDSVPWIDVFWADHHCLETTGGKSSSGIMRDIWMSYLDSGSRAQQRQQSRCSASADLLGDWRLPRVTVSIEKRTALQLGSHFLRLCVLELEEGVWGSESSS